MVARKPNRGARALLRAAAWIGVAAAATFGLVDVAQVRAQSSPAAAWENAAGGKQAFEVASVRADKSGDRSYSNFSLDNGNTYLTISKDDAMTPRGTLFMASHLPLFRYIIFAYKLSGTQELALRFDFWQGLDEHVPALVRNGEFDIEARAPYPATKDQMRMMMQSLLAERFKLAVSWQTREVPVYAMVLLKPGKLGPQLQPHPASDNCATTVFPAASGKGVPAAQPTATLPIPCGEIAHLPTSAPGAHRIGGRDITLAMLAESLPTQTGLVTLPRPVLDGTGLKGGFDFSMEWTPEDTSFVDNHESGGTFREALKKELGLKLQPEKGPVEILVVDHVEPPSPN